MLLRLGVIALLIVSYFAGAQLHAQHAPVWVIALCMGLVFVALVTVMYLRVLPAVLALPILAFMLAALAGMDWKSIFTDVIEGGGMRLKSAIFAAILGSILAQLVEKTGIAQTAIKKTAELGGDQPLVLAFVLTIVIAILFTTLGGLGAVIMVATIVLPILMSLGLRPLFVGCLFLLAMSLGGAFNLANWELFKTTLHLTNADIGAFAWPFAGLMLITTVAFLLIEGKRMGKSRFKAAVNPDAVPQQFVPWYALLTPVIPLLPVLFFMLLPKMYAKAPAVKVTFPAAQSALQVNISLPTAHLTGATPVITTIKNDQLVSLKAGRYIAWVQNTSQPVALDTVPPSTSFIANVWTESDIQVAQDKKTLLYQVTAADPISTAYDFPISVALLLGILYGAIVTWRRGSSTVQLLTKSAFDGVSAIGPALVLMLGIGMVLIATMSPQVSTVIQPILTKVAPHGHSTGAMVAYVIIFTVLAPLALYRGPLNLWGMGSGLVGALIGYMPSGAIMGAFMSVGMIQGVCDPTNTHNVWIANYTNTDVQDILKRTLSYMWILSAVGLILSAFIYYR